MKIRILRESLDRDPPQIEKYGDKILSDIKKKWKVEGDWYVYNFRDNY